MYIDTIVKRFGMENSKRGFIQMRHGVQIPKEHSPKTPEDRALVEKDSVCIDDWIHHVSYDMYKTRCDICSKCYEQISG